MDGKRIKCLRFSSLFLLIFVLFDFYRNTSRDNTRNEKKPVLEHSDTQAISDENIQRIKLQEDNARNERKYVLEQSDPKTSDIENIQTNEFQKRNLQRSSSKDELEELENKEADLIKNKMFWSEYAESFVPKGVSFEESMKLVKNLRGNFVKTIRNSTSKMCGDVNNAIAGLEDGTVVCVRYSENPLLVYAEVLAFYLSRMFQMDNVPEAVLAKVNSSAARWKDVDLGMLPWQQNRTVVMMRQIPEVCPCTFIPQIIKEAYLKGRTVTRSMFRSSNILNPTDIAAIIQWGTLIIFDNLIGNFDRLNYWIRFRFTDQLHNSLKSSKGKIWLIDHEKTIFYLYKVRNNPVYNYNQLIGIHDRMLKTMCVFQSSLVNRLRALSTQPSPLKALWNYTQSYEPLLEMLMIDFSFDLVANLFKKRLAQIMQWIEHCKTL